MEFFKALSILEKDLEKYLDMKVPSKVGAGLQFTNIMTEFVDNINNLE